MKQSFFSYRRYSINYFRSLGRIVSAFFLMLFLIPVFFLENRAFGQEAVQVDLELVLAVDASTSVSAQEFDLQMRGIAQAFRDPSVVQAIAVAGDRGVAVAVIQWANNLLQKVAVDWFLIRDQESAAQFADIVDETPRYIFGGGTSIGGAILYSTRQMEINPFIGARKVIDISGDGRSNQGAPPELVRNQSTTQGIVINGLTINNEDPFIDRYYEKFVIGGTGAFVQTATTYEDFGAAMKEKLIKEIGGVPVAAKPNKIKLASQ
ncbi:DUF1194 domain-containing protein [Kiloniella litopenaei]|uniref:DUF1194 domain-containing protein n=1 Tax=Kiloniella litopenaei TaxID=1549748 RepID=UPI003BABE43D